jgi:two-component system cell cycle sensor histidine kinase/response regulator CckA
VDLGRIVHDVVEFSRPAGRMPPSNGAITITVETDIEPVPPMQGNAAELREVLLNLVINAVDALPRGGTIRIAVRHASGEVQLVVQDTGVGMTEAVRSKIFEPFFTTKGSRGSGLGLSASYGIISRLGGTSASKAPHTRARPLPSNSPPVSPSPAWLSHRASGLLPSTCSWWTTSRRCFAPPR